MIVLPRETGVAFFVTLNSHVRINEAYVKSRSLSSKGRVSIKKQSLQKLLKNNVIAMSFQKVTTGFRRDIICTINRQFLRDYADILGYKEPRYRKDMTGTNYIIVWDLEEEDWRTVNAKTARIVDIMSFDDYLNDIHEY